ncbi:glycoside hydrolase family 13 protein [Anaerostipes faecalis]|uniref:glycoside hydrolase family 13 protein n=1 Tax=Anaerostipes faecalis TaxID=2738446 RepID=UPI003EFF602A
MIHNASIEKYRAPIGAVEKGEDITLRLFGLPKNTDSVDVIYYSENFHRELRMKQRGDCCEKVITMPEECCIIWYYFRIWEADHCYFYGAKPGVTQGEGTTYGESPGCFQITVYEKGFDTPRWMSKGIMYQIFPDRFCKCNPRNLERGENHHRRMGRDVYIHKEWEERPLFGPLPGKQFYDPCDYFGGDLEGIISQLDELKKLGVTCIYLNPIGEAASNHRYNTSDYKKVDPFLGTNEDFKRLCKIAKEKRIHVILDGVYSHTGDDSVYFNKKGNYPGYGAYQGPESPYYDWYTFHEDGTYESWWGFQSLPEVKEMNDKFVNYIITGKNSVLKHWLSLGASGFRLDVADELPDEFIFLMRKTLKSVFKNHVLLGEVWEDVTTKESYGIKRKYALGDGLDSAMNYPFKVNTTNYLLGYVDAYAMQEFLLGQQCNYPKPFYYAVMNLLSSHDIPRIRTTFASGMNETLPSREKQAEYVITSKMDKQGARLTRLAMAIQFFIPGMPCIYYGDEYGMHGFMDPFNRETFYKNDVQVYQELKEITSLRSKEKVLQTGYALYFAVNKNVLAMVRFVANQKDVFGEKCGNKALLMLVNPTDQKEKVVFDLRMKKEGVPEKEHKALIQNLENKVIREEVAPFDYKIIELS